MTFLGSGQEIPTPPRQSNKACRSKLIIVTKAVLFSNDLIVHLSYRFRKLIFFFFVGNSKAFIYLQKQNLQPTLVYKNEYENFPWSLLYADVGNL